MKKRLILALVLLVCFLCSCGIKSPANSEREESVSSSEPSKAVYQKISAEQAKSMIDEGKPYILLDVRTDEEFKEKRIDGAILIPDDEIKTRAETELSDKDALILIYCRSGRRSANAAKEMIGMGYTNVYDFGGIIDWPYDTISDSH